MARPCSICNHPKREEIDAALVAGTPLRDIARQFKTGKDALARHKAHVANIAPMPMPESASEPAAVKPPRLLLQKSTGRVYPLTEQLAARSDMEELQTVEQCATCRFWLHGECHRYPPTIDGMNRVRWPRVASTAWCGEWATR
jgi:hypothetical protein